MSEKAKDWHATALEYAASSDAYAEKADQWRAVAEELAVVVGDVLFGFRDTERTKHALAAFEKLKEEET